MNRQQKLATLKKNKALNAPESLADFAELAKIMEATVGDFKKLLATGIEITDLDVLTDRLEAIPELAQEVTTLKDAIANFPKMPEEVRIASVNEFIDAISKIEVKAPDVVLPAQKQTPQPDYTGTIKQIAVALAQLAVATKANAPKSPSQRPQDFVPMRRVIKDGNIYKFDDSADQGGGGTVGTPTRRDASNNVYVPVANPDGTSIGAGGGSGSATGLLPFEFDDIQWSGSPDAFGNYPTATVRNNGVDLTTLTFTYDASGVLQRLQRS